VEALVTANGGHNDPVIHFLTGRKILKGGIVRSDLGDHFALQRLVVVKELLRVTIHTYRTYVLQPSLSAGFLSS